MYHSKPNGTGPCNRKLSISSWHRRFPVAPVPGMMMTTLTMKIPRPKKILQLSRSGLMLKMVVGQRRISTPAPFPKVRLPASQRPRRRIQQLQCLPSRRVRCHRRMSVGNVGNVGRSQPSASCLVKMGPWHSVVPKFWVFKKGPHRDGITITLLKCQQAKEIIYVSIST